MTDSRTIETITARTAQALLAAAAKAADGIGIPMCIAVSDVGGNLVGFLRMDGAALLSINIAIDKAYTAVGFGMPTHSWHDFIKDDAPLALGIVHTPRLVTFGGGYPVRSNGVTIAGIGISGGHYHQDMEVATAALTELGYPID